MVASRFNSIRVIEYLLKKGGKIEKTDKDSFTPLLARTKLGKEIASSVCP